MFRENSYSEGLVEDFGGVCSEGVVSSSQGRGWQNFHVLQFRHERREMSVPPLANTLVMISLSTAANVRARINGREFSQTLQAGESVIIPAGTPSEWQCPAGEAYDMLHIYIQPALLSKAAAGGDINMAQTGIELEFGVRDPHIRHIGMSLLEELEYAGGAARAYADLLATALAVHLLRKHPAERDFTQSYSGGMPNYKLRRALDYISDKLGEELRVAQIAEEVNMSPFHFTRLFKQAMGLAPHQYIMQKRIERAKRLLVETELPIVQVALEIGFQSQSRFTTLFRQLTGITPKIYRGQNTFFASLGQSSKGFRLPYETESYLNAA